MTIRSVFMSAPVRALLVLFAITVVIGPMIVVASVWGVGVSIATVSASWLLMVIIVAAVVAAFIAGAAIAYVAKIGASITVHAAILIPSQSRDAFQETHSK